MKKGCRMNPFVSRIYWKRTHTFRLAAVRFGLGCCSDPSAMLGSTFVGSALLAVQHAGVACKRSWASRVPYF